MQRIAAGRNHTAIINDDGHLGTCGNNSFGQLGFHTSNPKQPTIKWVKKLGEVQAVAAGELFTAVIDEANCAWMFGDNLQGQLGLGNNHTKVSKPSKAKIPTAIRSVACGYSHALFLDENGDVWSAGMNRQGQLGHGDDSARRTPEKVEGLPPIQSVSCGSHYSTFLDTSGMVWMCGRVWVESHRSLASVVPMVWEGLGKIREVSSSKSLSMIITEEGDLIAGGTLNTGHFNLHRFELPPIKQAVSNSTLQVAIDHDGGLWRGGIDLFGCSTIPHGTLQKISGDEDFLVSSVAAGLDHLVLQTADGKVCTCGGNNFGQLGIGHCNATSRSKLNYLQDVSVRDIVHHPIKSARNI